MTNGISRFVPHCLVATVRLILAGSLVLAACGEQLVSNSTAIKRDSAAVQIVENQAAPSRWLVEADPAVDIGGPGQGKDGELYGVTSAVSSGRNTYYVANAGSREIREYEPRGSLIRTIGRDGEGPGEFRSLDALMLVGDTLVAYDRRLRRLSRFARDGHLYSVSTLQSHGIGPAGNPVRLADGTFVCAWALSTPLTLADSSKAKAGDVARGAVLLVRHRPTGEAIDTVGVFRGNEEALIETNSGISSARTPFARGLTYSAWGEDLAVGTQEDYEIKVFSRSSLARLVRVRGADPTITTSRLDRLLERLSAQAPTAGLERYIREDLPQVPIPDSAAAFGRFLLGRGADLWVSEPSFWFLEPASWDIFNRSGIRVGRVTMPERFELFEADSNSVLGLWRDSMDVEHLRAYPLHRGE